MNASITMQMIRKYNRAEIPDYSGGIMWMHEPECNRMHEPCVPTQWTVLSVVTGVIDSNAGP